jgi:serine/threonine-protein kinase OSR1/STK39
VAIKTIDLEQFPDTNITDLHKEIAFMATNHHKNIIPEYASFVDNGAYLWIVMPLVDAGSCLDILKCTNNRNGIKNEAVLATIIKESCDGLRHFHENHYVHRDIKAGNILMDMQGKVFLSDFGVSAHLKKGEKRGTLCGSPCWMAPEVLEQNGHDFKADIWSLGITAIELANGMAPYAD